MTRLILIRHGQTEYNSKSLYCGFTDIGLNAAGKSQARKLAERLKEEQVDSIYSSDLKRACQTAGIIFKGRAIKKSKDFRELNFGVFEGLNYTEIMKKYPEVYYEWLKSPHTVRIPGGERLSRMYKRVTGRLRRVLLRNKNKKLALVTHGGAIRVILCYALGYGLENFWKLEQANGALNIIDFGGNGAAKIVMMNDVSHLAGQEAA